MLTPFTYFAPPDTAPLSLEEAPRLATWDSNDSPSQRRMQQYQEKVRTLVAPALAAHTGPLALHLVAGLAPGLDLLVDRDLDNFLTPVVSALGSERFVAVSAVKRQGATSTLQVAPASLAPVALTGWEVRTARLTGSASTTEWKSSLSAQVGSHASASTRGPLELRLAFRVGPTRNWVNLWKPTIDSLGGILGSDSGRPWNPRDGRVVRLELHLQTDASLKNDVEIEVAWRSAKTDAPAGIRVVGVDGTADGWVAIELRAGAFACTSLHPTFAEVLARFPDAAAIAVDIPIGMPERGPRAADEAARSLLGARRSSVFPTPVQAVLRARDFDEAIALSRSTSGVGLSKQAWAIVPKIREVAEALAANPEQAVRVYEVHPEVSFAELVGVPQAAHKSTWNGLRGRIAALERAGLTLPEELGIAGNVNADDVVDAAVAAWSAWRIARGQARMLPATPEQQAGRTVAIWI